MNSRPFHIRTFGPPILVLASTIMIPIPYAAAQDTPRAGDPNCVCIDMETPWAMAALRFSRARLGVALGDSAAVAGRPGVRIREVTEGGAAARAGLRAGDVILSIDGRTLGARPVARVQEVMAAVQPEDTVTLEYGRDGQVRTARVVTDRMPAFGFAGRQAPPASFGPVDRADRMRGALRGLPVAARLSGPGRHRLQLVAMNEGLGLYFNVTEGVLVADIAEGSSLGLQPGDVILSIGGRKVEDPGHARSIIASYRPDEDMAFDLVRERRRLSITGSVGLR